MADFWISAPCLYNSAVRATEKGIAIINETKNIDMIIRAIKLQGTKKKK